MKKFLLTAALILAVITSLTAGTLAAYNQTLSITGTDAVKALKFDFSAKGSQELTSGVKLNPGKSQLYRVDITNGSEMTIQFKAFASFIGNQEFVGLLNSGWYENAEATQALSNNFTIQQGGSKTVYLKVTWKNETGTDANARDVRLSQQEATKATINVSINGSYTDTSTSGPSGNLQDINNKTYDGGTTT